MRLVLVFGPPAVGKMTVGREIVARSDFRLVHNHAVLEPLLELFDYGTPPFQKLLREFRVRMVEEAAAAGVDLVYTHAWGLELEGDRKFISELLGIYLDAGGEVFIVELYADLGTRLDRNSTELRLSYKPSKRDVEWSAGNVRELEVHVMNTTPGRRTLAHDLLDLHPHVRIDNTGLEAGEVAEQILAWVNR